MLWDATTSPSSESELDIWVSTRQSSFDSLMGIDNVTFYASRRNFANSVEGASTKEAVASAFGHHDLSDTRVSLL